MSVKIHVEPPSGKAESGEDDGEAKPLSKEGWPLRRELCEMLEEMSTDMLMELSNGKGPVGLCERLGVDPGTGLPEAVPDMKQRIEQYGCNAFAEKSLKAYWVYCWEALHDKILIMLICIATFHLVVEQIPGVSEHPEDGWIEPVGLYITVLLIVNVQSGLDWRRERMFHALSDQLAQSNLRYVIRDGNAVTVTDDKIVVGDIMSFNSHLAANISADGVLLAGEGVKMDESALTGEPEPIPKHDEAPFMMSGTIVNAGQGKMLVVAVGENSVSGKIKKAVYEDEEDEDCTPLYAKLDRMAKYVGQVGCLVALICFVAFIITGLDKLQGNKWLQFIPKCLMNSVAILAVAIPEGLPLALTISLAVSSFQMSHQNNLVKTLDSCETMGSATTICTDKTGTLTANRMTVRGAHIAGVHFGVEGAEHAGPRVKGSTEISQDLKSLCANLISVCTMDESVVEPATEKGAEPIFKGNPTECALLKFAEDMGFDWKDIRNTTTGRSESTRMQGVCKGFSSARKMMSWAVPRPEGGFRVYAKGASEIILGRVVASMGAGANMETLPMGDKEKDEVVEKIIGPFADAAMRTIGLAYKDMDEAPDSEVSKEVQNSDGSPAFASETELTLVGIVAIEDPLRKEVPGAIERCYAAGIDVRMVTGDNLQTAIAIAKGAGILKKGQDYDPTDGVLKPKRAMEGKVFRKTVHKYTTDGEAIFQQDKFDEIWPYLRVLARSSPEDKLTLAKGLNGSFLFKDKHTCRDLRLGENITIFPDQQVVAMTGDGTNDAPALKAADVGFAMGISGTQIAKDAANIILLDDNFASIVTAALWGRNVCDSIKKFLQFQLTVNIAILVIVTIGACSGKDMPLSVLQMLWINMIMDSLASLALASEPPTPDLLQRPPVNRSEFIITEQMMYNMVGQACLQVIIVVSILFKPHDLVPDLTGETGKEMTVHYTVIFNIFVLLQAFNEYNSRKLHGEINIFSGILSNRMFLFVSGFTIFLQLFICLIPGPDGPLFEKVFKVKWMTPSQWGFCFGMGVLPIPWQFVINAWQRVVSRFGGTAGILQIMRVGNHKKGENSSTRLPALSTRQTQGAVETKTSKVIQARRSKNAW